MKILRIALLCGVLAIGPATAIIAADKLTVGWTEIVSIFPGGMKVKAKLDTGADNSSLNARNIDYFDRDGERWTIPAKQFGTPFHRQREFYRQGVRR
jgi:hypothetical protein